MADGFLGNGASFMLDVIVCVLFLVVPLLGLSIWLARAGRKYRFHKTIQIVLAVTLLATLLAFEIDLHFIHGGWLNVVNQDATAPPLAGSRLEFVRTILRVHLVFAVSTPPLWAATILLALRHFPDPPRPGAHSRWHVRLGWISAADLVMTSVTGIAFYYFAFATG